MSYYHRPNYNKSHRSSINYRKLWVALFVLSVFGLTFGDRDSVFFAAILFYGLLGVVVYSVFKKVRPKKKQVEPFAESREIAEINSAKHGCKCYMEGLSDGEQEVAHLLSRELSYKDYFIFNNIILPSKNNKSTQADHVIVSRFGIIVIESKDYQGWIFGSKSQKTWTQLLPGGKNKFQFQNPIHQNYAHIMALKDLLPFFGDNFTSIVVFSNKSEFKTGAIENVVNFDGLIGCIKKYTQEKLSEQDVEFAIGRLSFLCQTLDVSVEEHLANLQANHVNNSSLK